MLLTCLLLSTSLAQHIMPPLPLLTFERSYGTINLDVCKSLGNDLTSHEIDGQGQRSRLRLGLGSQFKMRSVGSQSSIGGQFSSCYQSHLKMKSVSGHLQCMHAK